METQVQIIPYHRQHHDKFRELNLEWLEKYNLAEELDRQVLDDPEGHIIDKGGHVWLAKAGDEVIGTAALANEGHGVYELAKMSVAPAWRGKGISKMLIETCLAKAAEIGALKVELFSNSQLLTALKLYERYGFHYVEVENSPFLTADIKMALDIQKYKP